MIWLKVGGHSLPESFLLPEQGLNFDTFTGAETHLCHRETALTGGLKQENNVKSCSHG